MSEIIIRQSGGANIVSIPKAILKTLDLHVGSRLDLSVKDDKLILIPVRETTNLDYLLSHSPKKCFEVTEEDWEWIDARPAGKEL
ncbi:MAG TPA: AbrB/MazE/SpoVT family DNA-binding domain-containing protein [Chromatiaceae bacterium]|nr:AbrB/MazE/SpoVT family DNA-binding domain-containing protein [Chromatiaceae bacterium]